jgi:hypothetical protein
MLKATLIVSQPGQATQEVSSGESVTSIGSALDNTVCLEDDASIARYHAVIERRGEGFWLSDLGTRQGTKVNDETLVLERELEDGDRITLGGACLIEFYRHESSAQSSQSPETLDTSSSSSSAASSVGSELSYVATSATGTAMSAASSRISSRAAPSADAHSVAGSSASPVAAEATAEGASSSSKIIGASVLGAVVLTGAAAALLFNPFGGGCRPSARILTPLSGATLRSVATIRVEAGETQCIKRIAYQLDGEEVASASTAPYEATLDPRRLARFAAGNHVLTALVETTDGAEVRQPGEVYVALGAADNKGGTPAETPAPAQGDAQPAGDSARPASLVAADVQAMAERLASQISGKSGYVFEREMTARIQARTSEFASPDATEHAVRYRRTIVKAFSDRGVRPLLGFVLAMSRSKFDEASGAEGNGIWRIPASVARSYSQAGETTASLDSPQRAAEVAAVYLKDLLGVFESESFDLAVACYGCTLEEAGAMKQRLATVPAAERRNFWRMAERGIVTQEQTERVVRFYAAGIVGENPQRFGGASDRSLSSLEY